MNGQYVFSVQFRLAPSGVRVEPAAFETAMFKRADSPGEDGWLFFRDSLWRGELNSPEHFRELTQEALDVPVERVEYRRFEVGSDGYGALKEAIAADLDPFNAESVDEVLNKYFGSSIEAGAER